MSTLNNAGNDQDVYWGIYHAFTRSTIEDFQAAIDDEKANSNRSTRIKYLERAIKRKKEGKTNFTDKW